MSKEENKDNSTTEQVLAELLIRLSSLEKLLLNKKVVTQEELVSSIKDHVSLFNNEIQEVLKKRETKQN